MTLHKLKIDQSFVSACCAILDEAVVRAIVGIADEFGLLTTAEGVEDVETRNRLVELGWTNCRLFIGTGTGGDDRHPVWAVTASPLSAPPVANQKT